jgi:hypothetical protein
VISARRIFANQANARKCTGPKTSAGKARASRNGRRHGLMKLASCDPGFAAKVEDLARMIAGDGASPERFACACRIAAAQLDLKQVRDARQELLATEGPNLVAAIADRNLLKKLAPLNRYEQRALARRRFAIRDFDLIGRDERRRAKISRRFSSTKPTGENEMNSI